MHRATKHSVFISIALILTVVFALTGCGGTSTSAPSGSTSTPAPSDGGTSTPATPAPSGNELGTTTNPIRFMSAAVGGEWYPIAVSISEGWKNSLGYESTLLPGGGASNVLGLAQDQGDIAFTFSCTAVDGVLGNEPFEQPLTGYKALLTLNASYVQPVVYADSGIDTIADLAGKRINVYTKGYTSELNARLLLQLYGLSYEDMAAVNYLGDDDAIDQLKDGHLDCTISTGGIPDSGFIDMSSVRPVKILNMDRADLEEVAALNAGLYPTVIPAGTYGIPEDADTLGCRLMLIVREGLDEEFVYQLTKAAHENLETLYNVNSNMQEVTIESMPTGAGIDFHPGAIRYYTEQGVM